MNAVMLDPKDLLVPLVPLALKASRDLQEEPESLAPRETRDGLDVLVAWDPLDPLVLLVISDSPDPLDLQVLRVVQEPVDPQVVTVNQVPRDLPAALDHVDHLARMDLSVSLDHVGPPVLLDPRATPLPTSPSPASAAKDLTHTCNTTSLWIAWRSTRV